jgi:hypothetical protein
MVIVSSAAFRIKEVLYSEVVLIPVHIPEGCYQKMQIIECYQKKQIIRLQKTRLNIVHIQSFIKD